MDNRLNYLRRTFQIASFGLGYVNSYPLVGWLICCDHKIVCEDWLHEGNFTDALFKSIALIQKNTGDLYLNIDPILFVEEPEKLFQSIAISGIKNIILPSASKKLVNISRKYSLSVHTVSAAEEEAEKLNIRFYTCRKRDRPYVVLKWARTADGFIARKNYDSKWISNTHSRKLVHQWRSQEQAIMVGTNTCLYDDPQLNVRSWNGKNPVRIVPDRQLRLPSSLHVFDGTQPTLCYNLTKNAQQHNLQYKSVPEENFLEHILHDLAKRNIHSLFIEGGSQLLALMLKKGWWDEARVFQSTQYFQEGIPAPAMPPSMLDQMMDVADDQLLYYQNTNRK